MAADSFFEGGARKRKRGGLAKGKAVNGTSSAAKAAPRAGGSAAKSRKGKQRAQEQDTRDEELSVSGSDEDDEAAGLNGDLDGEAFDSDEEQDAKETPAQKRLRLARMYVESLKKARDEDGVDAAQLERDIIAERLQTDVLEASGKLHLRLADTISVKTGRSYFSPRQAHRLPLTSAVTTDDCKYLFTGSKDGSIIRWDISSTWSEPVASTSTAVTAERKLVKLDFIPKKRAESKETRKAQSGSKGKPALPKNMPNQDTDIQGHTDEIFSLSVSTDGKWLASGGKDRKLGIWDISNSESGKGCRWIGGLRGHKDSLVKVSFRLGTSQVYTAAYDRTVKIYDAAAQSYIETLFGHQDKIHDLSVLKNELAVTAGGRDKTLRYWKIRDESQLVFRAGTTSKLRRILEGGLEEDLDEAGKRAKPQTASERRFVEGSVDCVAMIDDQHFLSGGDSGAISLWSTTKKKPIFTMPLAHGIIEHVTESDGVIGNPRWITAVAALPYSDIFVTGSWDGQIRFWKIAEDIRSFSHVDSIPAKGCVNALQLTQLPAGRTKSKKSGKKGLLLAAALGQEHKLGRWIKVDGAQNRALVVVFDEELSRAA